MTLDRDIMLDLLREASGMMTTSWDWEMDLKFAERVGDDEAVDLLKRLLKSDSPFPLQIRVWDDGIRWSLTKRRLRSLRKLVHEGLVETDWAGTGRGGLADFGVSRIRGYIMKEVYDESK